MTVLDAETRRALRHAIDQAKRQHVDHEDGLYGVRRCPECDAHPDHRTEGCRHCRERLRARERRAASDPQALRDMWRAQRQRRRARATA